MIKILSTIQTIEKLSKALISHKKVYFSRFGDGDLLFISGLNKTLGGNRQKYSIELQKELHESLAISDPLYMKAISLKWETEPGMIKGLFAPFDLNENAKKKAIEILDNSTYFNPIVFHYLGLFKPEIFKDFIAQHIVEKRKMFIGSASKKNMEKFFGKINAYIQTPKTNSYGSIDQWYGEITKQLEGIELILPSTGFASRVISKRLWDKNIVAHVIDIGSIVDPLDNNFTTRTCWRTKGKEVREKLLEIKK